MQITQKGRKRFISYKGKKYRLICNVSNDKFNEDILKEMKNLVKQVAQRDREAKQKQDIKNAIDRKKREPVNVPVGLGTITYNGTVDNEKQAVNGAKLSYNTILMKQTETKRLLEDIGKKEDPLTIKDAVKLLQGRQPALLLGDGKKKRKKAKKRTKKNVPKQITPLPTQQTMTTGSPGMDLTPLLMMMMQKQNKDNKDHIEVPKKGFVNIINDTGKQREMEEGQFRLFLDSALEVGKLEEEVDKLTQIKSDLDDEKKQLEQDKILLQHEKDDLTKKISSGTKFLKIKEAEYDNLKNQHEINIQKMKDETRAVKEKIEQDYQEKIREIKQDIDTLNADLSKKQNDLIAAQNKIHDVEISNKHLEETKQRVEESKTELEKILKGLQLKNDLEKDLRQLDKQDIIDLAQRNGLLKTKDNYIEQILDEIDKYDWDVITAFSKKNLKPKGMTYIQDTPTRRSKIRTTLSNKLTEMGDDEILNFAKDEKINVNKNNKREMTQPKIIQKILNDDDLTLKIAKERGFDIDDIVLPE